jgi:hypothetical protein
MVNMTPGAGADGNRLIAALPEADRRRWQPWLEPVRMRTRPGCAAMAVVGK